jgi:cytoskeleton-associated protein 5
LGLVKKFVIDNNEAAKDKGLDAVYAYVENIPVAAKSVGEVMPGLISKCFNGREKTKNRAFEIVLMYIEAEKQEVVSEELIKGFDNKQPKVVSACLKILRRAMNEFGSKIILIKPIIKHISKLLEDRDKDVRDEARLMAVEMYRWAGAAIMPQFQGLKEIFMKELEEEFKKCNESGVKAKQVRFLRSQQDLKAKMEAEAEAKAMNGGVSSTNGGGGGGVSNEEVSEEVAVDPYDLLDPVDILLRLPKDFHEKLESKKWQDRKEALEALQGLLTANPKLVASDYHEVLNELKKVLAKDANIVVVGVAAKCVAGIANGLRKDFNKYVSIVSSNFFFLLN